ncbi:MAG: hypothetical protein ACR2QO_11485 [Acidimicrobiales bacterium]
MNRAEATIAVAAHAAEHLSDLGDRSWRLTAFDGGWLATPEGDDLRWRTGLACLVVLADGTIHQESSSLAPPALFAKYARSDPS